MSAPETNERSSRYLDYLPAIFREHPEGGDTRFIGRFLLAFEHVLTGVGDPDHAGLEEKLDGISDGNGRRLLGGVERYFDPGPHAPDEQRAPKEFLQWLSGWVALALRADLDELRQRDFIARSASLYRLRGTKQGLERMVRIYTRLRPTVEELAARYQVGVTSRVGADTPLGGGPPHFFRVRIHLATSNPKKIKHQVEVTRAIIEAEKPAHTYYELRWQTPELQIGVHSTVGVDTLLGEPE